MASITFKHVEKTYPGNVTVVPDLNLEIQDKEFVILVGPSGCGKIGISLWCSRTTPCTPT